MHSEGLSKVKKFLEEKEINYLISENEGKSEIIIPYMIDNLRFHPTISFHKNWLVVSALIIKKNRIPVENYNEMMRLLLVANHELPEINFDLSEEGDVYTSVDMRIEITDFENFFSEFYAIPFGIKFFIEKIAPPLNIEVSGFS